MDINDILNIKHSKREEKDGKNKFWGNNNAKFKI